jgi:molybdopterin-containing oxidoreductase family membrane subunit
VAKAMTGPSHPSAGELTDRVAGILLGRRAGRTWWVAFGISMALTLGLIAGIVVLLREGVGIWGNNMPVAWAFDITNYVWWIGIAMAGTFISAALYLTRQPWRAALARHAEAMTLFALLVSALFPVLHLGRPYFAYWIAPYPDKMDLWPQWRSALTWDFFAIGTYVLVSLLYFFGSLVPDAAAMRDRAKSRGAQVFHGLLALGWRGEAGEWRTHAAFSRWLAIVAVPLVFSVHSMVAFDFSEGLLPGWHSTVFPPFFVAGALFSGAAMVALLSLSLRRAYALEDIITADHLDKLGKLILAAGWVVTYGYAAEIYTAIYSGDPGEMTVVRDRTSGAFAWTFWFTIACNSVAIQPLWSRRVRRSPWALGIIAVLVLAGMWMERFMLIVTVLYHSGLSPAWGTFRPTLWDAVFLAGSMGLFALLFLLFVRLLPVLSLAELRKQVAGGPP